MQKDKLNPAPKKQPHTDEAPQRISANVTLPPIEATPEEIAQVLFQRPPPLKGPKPKMEEDDKKP